MSRVLELIEFYKGLTDEQIGLEVDSIFELVEAMLDATDSNSIEVYPDTNTILKIEKKTIKDETFSSH